MLPKVVSACVSTLEAPLCIAAIAGEIFCDTDAFDFCTCPSSAPCVPSCPLMKNPPGFLFLDDCINWCLTEITCPSACCGTVATNRFGCTLCAAVSPAGCAMSCADSPGCTNSPRRQFLRNISTAAVAQKYFKNLASISACMLRFFLIYHRSLLFSFFAHTKTLSVLLQPCSTVSPSCTMFTSNMPSYTGTHRQSIGVTLYGL